MRNRNFFLPAAVAAVVVGAHWVPAAATAQIFSENFDGVTLGPNVFERAPFSNVWTQTPPAGWTNDTSGVPAGGVTEWAGWSFVTPQFWLSADGQNRDQFTKGTGVIAVADGDEWDDKDPGPEDLMNAFLSTPPIPITGSAENSAVLTFDSSWRPEDTQTASITVSYDGAAPIEVLRWESAPASPNFHGDETNETVMVPMNNPASANSAVITFGYLNAGNDWWWAFDNASLTTSLGTVSENFDGLTLGPNVDEGNPDPRDAVWSKTGPAGWTVDDSGTPAGGVTEWRGWSFVDPAWWNEVAGQNRSDFTRGSGVIVVADGDEWDDAGHDPGDMNTLLSSPAISLAGAEENTLQLSFDSSWRPFDEQTGIVTVSYDGGEAIEILRLDSSNTDDTAFRDKLETVLLNNPAGASEMVITFGYLNAGNDWWWAIDNVEVSVIPEPATGMLALLALLGLVGLHRRPRR